MHGAYADFLFDLEIAIAGARQDEMDMKKRG